MDAHHWRVYPFMLSARKPATTAAENASTTYRVPMAILPAGDHRDSAMMPASPHTVRSGQRAKTKRSGSNGQTTITMAYRGRNSAVTGDRFRKTNHPIVVSPHTAANVTRRGHHVTTGMNR